MLSPYSRATFSGRIKPQHAGHRAIYSIRRKPVPLFPLFADKVAHQEER